MAAGSATIRLIRSEGLHEHAAQVGERLRKGLQQLQGEFPQIGDVRGRGLMLGAEVVDPDARPDHTRPPPAAPALASAIQTECLRRGLIVELGGRHGCVVRFLPPLVITEREIDHVLEIFGAAVRVAARPR